MPAFSFPGPPTYHGRMSEALHVVILAAGEGKRMNSAKPKVLLPVATINAVITALLVVWV